MSTEFTTSLENCFGDLHDPRVMGHKRPQNCGYGVVVEYDPSKVLAWV